MKAASKLHNPLMSKPGKLTRILKSLGVPTKTVDAFSKQADELRRKQADGTLQAELEARMRAMKEEIARQDPLEHVRMVFEERWEKLGYDALLPEERDHLHLWWLNAEVNNGGFEQYLMNSTGDNAPDALESLARLGAAETHRVLADVISLVGASYPADRAERQKRINEVRAENPENWKRRISELSDEYYECDESLQEPASRAMLAAYRREGVPLPPLPI